MVSYYYSTSSAYTVSDSALYHSGCHAGRPLGGTKQGHSVFGGSASFPPLRKNELTQSLVPDCAKSRFFENAVWSIQWLVKPACSKNGVLTQSDAPLGVRPLPH